LCCAIGIYYKPTIAFDIPPIVPVNVGLAKFAFKFNALEQNLPGLLASLYYQHLLNQPLLCYSTYCSVNVGLNKLLSLMQPIVVDTGLFASDILST
jgi:hypothetical protein